MARTPKATLHQLLHYGVCWSCRGSKLCITGTQGALPRHLDDVQTLPEGPRLRLPRWCGCGAEYRTQQSYPSEAAEPPAEEAVTKTTTWHVHPRLHYISYCIRGMLEPCRWGRKLCTGIQGALPRQLGTVQLPEDPRLRLPRWCSCGAEHQGERSCPGQAAKTTARHTAKASLHRLLHYGVCWSCRGSKLCITGTQGALPRHLDDVQLPEDPRLRLPRWYGCGAEHQGERSCPGQAAKTTTRHTAKASQFTTSATALWGMLELPGE